MPFITRERVGMDSNMGKSQRPAHHPNSPAARQPSNTLYLSDLFLDILGFPWSTLLWSTPLDLAPGTVFYKQQSRERGSYCVTLCKLGFADFRVKAEIIGNTRRKSKKMTFSDENATQEKKKLFHTYYVIGTDLNNAFQKKNHPT